MFDNFTSSHTLQLHLMMPSYIVNINLRMISSLMVSCIRLSLVVYLVLSLGTDVRFLNIDRQNVSISQYISSSSGSNNLPSRPVDHIAFILYFVAMQLRYIMLVMEHLRESFFKIILTQLIDICPVQWIRIRFIYIFKLS